MKRVIKSAVFKGTAGGGLFGLFLTVSGTLPDSAAVQEDFSGKDFRMIRALFADHSVSKDLIGLSLNEFLKGGFIISAAFFDQIFPFCVQEHAMDQVRRGINPAIEVNGGEDGFRGVGEDRGSGSAAAGLLPSAQFETSAEFKFDSDLKEALFTDEGSADSGQIAFREVRVSGKEVFGGNKAQDGITEELKAFVAGEVSGPMFVSVRAVAESLLKQFLPPKGIIEFFLQIFHKNVHSKRRGSGNQARK